MRRAIFLAVGAALVGCSTYSAMPPGALAPMAPMNARAQAEFTRLTAGKVARPAVACMPTFRSNDDMRVIDERTIVFRESSNRVYVNNLAGGCPGVGWGHNALVFNHISGSQLCQGDFARIVDTSNGIQAGTCVLGPFIPYTRP